MGKLFWKIHRWCGIYSGGFVALILITGAVAVFKNDIYLWENRHLAELKEPATLDVARLDQWVKKASAEFPDTPGDGFRMGGVFLPQNSRQALRIQGFNPDGAREPFRVTDRPWFVSSVFVHPETGEILGTGNDGYSMADYLRSIHVRLFAGTPGRYLVGLFGLWFLVSTVSGLLILAKFLGKKAIWVIRTKNCRLATSDWHKLIGLVSAIPALVFAVTGFWLGLQGLLMGVFSIENPARYERAAIIDESEDRAFTINYVEAFRAVNEAYPGLIIEQILPSTDGSRTLKLMGRTDGMIYESASQIVVLDKTDSSVLFINNTHEGGWGEKLYFLQEGLHFGRFGGAWVKWAYLIVGLMLGVLPITGYIILRCRQRESLRSIWIWTGVGVGYSILMLGVVMGFGTVPSIVYGALLLATFLLGLLGWGGINRWREKKQRKRIDLAASNRGG